MAFLSQISGLLWGGPLLVGFLAVGLYYSLRTGFFQIFGLPVWWKHTVGALFQRQKAEQGGVTQLQALSTALAATIGTGSARWRVWRRPSSSAVRGRCSGCGCPPCWG